ncbi:amino acid ABC transporter permease [Paraburkholderia sp. BL6665CI2N2]|uniref:amino acid ABC transporter permease n=1 Tax=Paraburkholderia sp. BL6665CI2N2 TaxID=1938806 RepID=UPI001065422A|nr:amino acid ABC transporter permease [Paraburkholderia sp. BL6665CI2N2]
MANPISTLASMRNSQQLNKPHRTDEIENFVVVPLRRPGRWLSAALMLFVLLTIADLLITNPRWQWPTVMEYLVSTPILVGVGNTLLLTVLAELVGISLGIVLAILRLSENPLLSWSSAGFTWIFRGIPPMVMILFIYFLSALVPMISIGIPFGPSLKIIATNKVVTQLVAAVIGLGLAQAAYVAEIVRSGILSVSAGQSRAALALGMTPMRAMRHIVFPQAMRVVVPPLSNEVISMVKATSLVSIIGFTELLTTVQIIYGRTFEQIPLLMVAVIWYGVITTILTLVQSNIERRLNKSVKIAKKG